MGETQLWDKDADVSHKDERIRRSWLVDYETEWGF